MSKSFIFILIFFTTTLGFTQIEEDSAKIVSASHLLKVTNYKKGIIKYFGENEVIVYRLRDAPPLKLYGTIEQVDKDSLIVSGNKIAVNDLIFISSKAQKKEMHLVYSMLTLAGVLTTTSGVLLLTVGTASTAIIGAASVIIGAPLLVGGIKRYFASNYLRPEKGWAIETVKFGGIPESLSSH